MKLTTKIKLLIHPTSVAYNDLLETMQVFNAACQVISEYAFEHRCFNKRNLQDKMYYDIQRRFALPAQLIVRAFAKVSDSYKTQKTQVAERIKKYELLSPEKQAKRKAPELKCCQFRDDGCVVYDSRLLSYQPNSKVSIRTLSKRHVLRIKYSPCHDASLILGEADLILQDGVFYLHQTMDIPEALPSIVDDFLGVDLGLVHIAVDSDGQYYDNDKINKHREKYTNRRNALKKVKTPSSRHRLKSMSKRNGRFNKDVNHCISKSIVRKAKALDKGLVMENLSDFFDKTKVRRKDRLKRHSWAFFQLRTFCEYKSIRDGVPFVLVNPIDTSRECSECHYIDKKNRKSQSEFVCLKLNCGHSENADVNASKNIRNRAYVNKPEAIKIKDFDCGEVATKVDSKPVCYKPLALAMG